MKPRQNLYFDADLSKRLDELSSQSGVPKSAIVADALRSHLDRRGVKELDDKLKSRFDTFGTQLNRMERNQRVVIESLALYIRFHFSVLPPLTEADQAAGRSLAHERYQAFIEQVARKMSGPRSMVDDVLDHPKETRQ
ncbi:MAG: CopG family transcriptional regulator [Pseudomonadota bacterium]